MCSSGLGGKESPVSVDAFDFTFAAVVEREAGASDAHW